MEGAVHKQKQGSGLATVFDIDRLAEIKQKKAAEKKASAVKLADYDPEAWYVFDNEIRTMADGVVDTAAQLMTSGIRDPFNSVDPRAVEWRKQMKRVDRYAKATMTMKEDFSKLQTLYLDPEKQKKIENWDEISDYYLGGKSIQEIVDSGTIRPMLKYKRPPVQSMSTYVSLSKTWKDQNPNQAMNTDKAINYALDVVSDESYAEFVASEKQSYESLPQSRKNHFQQIAVQNGQKDGFFAFLGQKINSYTNNTPVDVDKLIRTASQQALSFRSNTGEIQYMKNKNKIAESIAKGILSEHPFLIDSVPGDLSQDEKYDILLKDYTANTLKYLDATIRTISKGAADAGDNNIDIGALSRAGAGGVVMKSKVPYDEIWLEDLFSSNPYLKAQAADYIVTTKMFGGLVTDTKVNPQGDMVTFVIKGDAKEVEAEISKPGEEGALNAYQMSETKTATGQTQVTLQVELNEENKQALRSYYNMAWQDKKNNNYASLRNQYEGMTFGEQPPLPEQPPLREQMTERNQYLRVEGTPIIANYKDTNIVFPNPSQVPQQSTGNMLSAEGAPVETVVEDDFLNLLED